MKKSPEIFKSIRVRLILSHLIAIILVMMVSGFLLLSFLQNYFLQTMEDGLLAQARITTQILIPGAIAEAPFPTTSNVITQNYLNTYNSQDNLESQDNLFLYRFDPTETVTGTQAISQNDFFTDDIDITLLEEASLQMGTQLNTRIRILDKQGQIVIDSEIPESETSMQTDPLAIQALEGSYGSYTETIDEQQVMSVAVPAFVDNRLVGVVYLSQPLDTILIVL